MKIEIDLKDHTTEEQVTIAIGKVLKFADWVGYNWDAFHENMESLDGTNLQPGESWEFPLEIAFKNTADFAKASPKDFEIFQRILASVQKYYSRHEQSFSYSIS